MTRAKFEEMVRAGGEQRREAIDWLAREWFDTFDMEDMKSMLVEFHRGDHAGTAHDGLVPFFRLTDEEVIETAVETISSFGGDEEVGDHSVGNPQCPAVYGGHCPIESHNVSQEDEDEEQ